MITVKTIPIKQVKNEKDWPSEYSCNFLEAGLVSYEDSGAGIAMLRKETILKMMPTFIGKPVVIDHIDVTPKDFKNHAVGYITKVWFDDYSGWAMCSFILTDDKAKEKVAKGYSVSCAYDVLSTSKGGEWHAIKYDEEITDGSGTHLALVTSPRYEAAKISPCMMLVNSKRAIMKEGEGKKNTNKKEDTKMIQLYKKANQKAGAEVDPNDPTKQKWNAENVFVQIENEYVPLAELAKHAKQNDFEPIESVENEIEINGAKHTVADLVANYKASKAKNEDKEEDKKENEEEEKKEDKKNEDKKEEEKKENADEKDDKSDKEQEKEEERIKENEDKEEEKKEDKKNSKKSVEHFVKLNTLRENGMDQLGCTIDTQHNRVERGVNRYGSK